MKKFKNHSKLALSVVILGGALTPYAVHAEAVQPINGTTEVTGTFASTTLDVSIPATSSFIYNPDTGTADAEAINVQSNTNAPVKMKSIDINVSDTSPWRPVIVDPGFYTDTQWQNLTGNRALGTLALGVLPIDNENWMTKSVDTLWKNSLRYAESTNFLGDIKPKSNVSLTPTVKAGTSIKEPIILISEYVFEFSLSDGNI